MAGVNADKERAMIDFGRGNPPPEAFSTRQLQECAAAILEEQASVVLQYYPGAGGQTHSAMDTFLEQGI